MGEKPSILGEPPLGAYETSPCGRFKAVGPTGRAADQGGRPACWWRPLPPTARGWACLGLAFSEHQDRACPKWVWYGLELHLVRFEPESVL